MNIQDHAPTIDEILAHWRAGLGTDYDAYRNHCYRVLNLCRALGVNRPDSVHKICIAAAFHDLGIWVSNTFDYLQPSRRLAREYLSKTNQDAWLQEIEAMIEQHHKLTRYKTQPDWLVETFRKADWIDVSGGRIRFGVAAPLLAAVMDRFPNAGFHRRLLALTWQRFKRHPFSPLPMMRL